MASLDEKVLETCSLMDLLLCHLLQRLIDLSGGLVLEDELSIRRKRKAKTRFEMCSYCKNRNARITVSSIDVRNT